MKLTLRITGGEKRGRKLLSPPKNSLRPASDLIRQAVFNMLRNHLPDCDFYDVFAGTGIVGIEALSRGARSATFVEFDRQAVALIRQNLQRAELADAGVVRQADAFVWAGRFVPTRHPTIVFLGPPYPEFEAEPERYFGLVTTLQANLSDDDVLALQLPSEIPIERLPDFDHWHRIRKYGKTRIALWRRGEWISESTDESESGMAEEEREEPEVE